MARIESQAVAGFYATPEDQTPRIASLLQLEEYDDKDYGNVRLSVVDPCAGEGVAIETVARILTRPVVAAERRAKAAARVERAAEDRAKKIELEAKLPGLRTASEAYAAAKAAGEKVPWFDTTGVARTERELVTVTERIAAYEKTLNESHEVKAAVEEMVAAEDEVRADIYAIELEEGRHKAFHDRRGLGYRNRDRVLHGDAFRVAFKPAKDSGVGLLWLNPPYDIDKVCGRLEEKFLRRYTDVLAPGGVLVDIVPYYALAASADTFARKFEDVACYRFAGDGFNIYKQVVVFAKKLAADRLEPDEEIRALVERWSRDGASCPELPAADKPHKRSRYVVPMHSRNHLGDALTEWKLKLLDVSALLGKHVPWHETTRKGLAPMGIVVPQFPLVECMHRTYEVATLPRPAHIAAGLAAGLFNGQRIEPDDESSKLPPLLVKGCFDREWRTVEEKHNKDGEKTGEVQVQTPKLVVTILDLRDHAYYTVAGGESKTVAVVQKPALSIVVDPKTTAACEISGRLMVERELLALVEAQSEKNDKEYYHVDVRDRQLSREEHRERYEEFHRQINGHHSRIRELEKDAENASTWDAIDAKEKARTARGAACDVSQMSIQDMLKWYGRSLASVMERQCVTLYDSRRDGDRYELVPTPRKLFVAQAHAAKGIITVLEERGDERQPILIGEIGCLRGDTMIHDPVAGDTVAVAERYRRAEPFHVWALSPRGEPVVAAAMPPAKYPVSQMVKVTMDDGSFVVVTPAHRFWDGREWLRSSDLACEISRQQEFGPVHLPTSSDSDLRVRARDASRWSQTTPGSLDGCLPYRCSDDGQLPSDQGSDRGFVPSRGGAHEHNPHSSRVGDLEHKSVRNRQRQSFAHRSKTDSEVRSGDQHLELFLPPHESRQSNELGSTQESRKSPEESFPARTFRERGLDASTSMTCEDRELPQEELHQFPEDGTSQRGREVSKIARWLEHLNQTQSFESLVHTAPESSFSSVVQPSLPPVRSDCDLTDKNSKRVVSVEPVSAENYYDFHVPVFNNYWAAGLWHHNSGKSTVSIVAARTFLERHGKRGGRLLIFCPPHLLDSWRNEVAAVFPDADYRVLTTVSDVDAIADVDPNRFLVAVLSRETAKLGHRLEGVSGVCPSCGGLIKPDAEDLAKKRSRCERYLALPGNSYARVARNLALHLRPWVSSQYLPRGTGNLSLTKRWERVGKKFTKEPPTYPGLPLDLLSKIRDLLVDDCENAGYESPVKSALVWALAAGNASPETILAVVRELKPEHYDHQNFAASLLLLLPQGGALGLAYELLETFPSAHYGQNSPPSSAIWFKAAYAKLWGTAQPVVPKQDGEDDDADKGPITGVDVAKLRLSKSDGVLKVNGYEFGSLDTARQLLSTLGSMGAWGKSGACTEPLYQSVPEPRRYPLAKYIIKYHRNTFDFVIIDEAHEAGNADSAQSVAAHRLTALKLPSILMTGTIMNGYAESLFANFWGTDMEFRREFGRREEGTFVDRYGYRKRFVSDKEDGKVVAYGSQSDRVERKEKDVGSAPGVLPLFLFKHLLKGAVTLHKSDLRIDLPKLIQERSVASASGELLSEFTRMLEALVTQIKADRFSGPDDGGLAGKLFGQLSEIPSYLDRATVDVGNGYGDAYEVHYPESVGGELVTSAKLFPKNTILPKEQLMLDVLRDELKKNRRAMVFGWHLELLPRLARLLQEHLDVEAPILYADKVPTAKRQAWIEKNILAKKRRIMVVNPVCIQTGLNSLTHFHTIWQHENPACNPLTDRQSIGRIDRIGQTLETRVFRAFYGLTLQEKMYDLHMNKIAISTATDGLDPETAMLAAGIEPSSFVTGLSLGKALWAMLEEQGALDELEERPRLRLVVGGGGGSRRR